MNSVDMSDREVFGTAIDLPSRGLPYEGRLGPQIHVSPMTTREEKLIVGSQPGQALQAIDTLLTRCCQLGDMKPEELVSGDRFFLVNVIRAVTYGAPYTFTISCEVCNQRFKHTLNLPDDLTIVSLPEGFTEPFTCTLPVSKAEVDLRLLRGKDEREIAKYSQAAYAKFDNAAADPVYSYRAAKQIVRVRFADGRVLEHTVPAQQQDLMAWYDGLYAQDARTIRETLNAHDCGPDPEIDLACPRCRATFQTRMPYQVEFFRPGALRSA